MVGIPNTNRTRDLTPPSSNPGVEGGFWDPEGYPTAGGGDAFLAFIESELIPFIDARCRTVPFRAFTGHSFGGLLAVRALTQRPELFDAVIATSPTLYWDAGQLVEDVKSLLAGDHDLPKSFFYALGAEVPPMQKSASMTSRRRSRRRGLLGCAGARYSSIQRRI